MLRRDISVNEVRKINYEDRLRYAQKTTAVFESTEAGRWNVFADQIERGEESVYANALALMALLDAKSANLPWMHSTDQRDALLRATAAVLIDQFEVTSRRSGWRPNVGLAAAQKLAQTVSQELSCMVAAQLLRAEEFEQIRVPAPILAEVDRLLERLASRAFDWTYSTGYYARTFKDLNGRTVAQQANVTFLWYPWAVALCAQTLQRSERLKDVDRGSRATKCLKHLVVDFKDQVLGELTAVDSSSWHQAESLYALSFVVDRDPIGVHTNE
jgi:hypothetical protein